MFERLNLLVSDEVIDNIKNTSVLIVGVGGVGGAAFEALVRLGIGKICVIDNDSFDVSNLNRQILSNLNNLGQNKAKEACLRAKSINSDIFVDYKEMFLNEANIDEIDYSSFDYIIDCCDTVSTKLLLVKKAIINNVKIISSMGTGNRIDPTKLVITNIWKTENDPLAKVMRKLLRENNINYKLPVVYSTELPIKNDKNIIGSCVLVPNTAGLYLASFVFNDIINSGK